MFDYRTNAKDRRESSKLTQLHILSA